MGARKFPRPNTGIPASPDEIVTWLRFLCLSSDSRGLAGYELAESRELLGLTVLTVLSHDGSCEDRAQVLREVLKAMLADEDDTGGVEGDLNTAALRVLGLTALTGKQPRAVRRRLAADAAGMNLNTFQKRYEHKLLLDVAHEVWRLELRARAAMLN